ncbi:TIGR00366 family protein [Mycetocola miduiensis]|uniref:Short-chain fatty acids transporter n=1 Tax=Mycetocola miduiensis TaxID=995034 RepID=A0A1I5C726_9MICO|nr:TIGR00366 family protein [Mycetocola miduiensis]SFN82758.1 short-chain fatty acids transporter [Mycetocola miduiensis]
MSTTTQLRVKESASEKVATWYAKYFPDSLIFALVLTVIAMILALIFTDSGPGKIMDSWFVGIPMLFTFAFQLAFTYAAALVLVDTPKVQQGIVWLARKIKTPQMAYIMTGVVGALVSFAGWYIGPVVTAIFARAVAKEMNTVDFRLISAIAYSSFVISLTGISGTIPLFVASEGPLTELVGGLIGLEDTTFSIMNLVSAAAIVLATTITFYFIARNKKNIVSYADLAIASAPQRDVDTDADTVIDADPMGGRNTFADKINRSRIPILFIGLLGLGYLIYFFWENGLSGLNLNTVAFVALVIGFLVQKNAIAYAASFSRNLVSTGSIMLQFPIYGGIASIFALTGLAGVLTDGLVSIATPETYLTITFLITGVLNMFVPSAGSQFVATAPFFIPAGEAFGIDNTMTVMAITYGDIWTNLIQPFWALLYFPILAVGTKLRVRDFMGYCLPILIIVGIIWILALNFLPLH